jgi:hypothetical protein
MLGNLTSAAPWRCHSVVKFPANEPGPFVVDAWGDHIDITGGAVTGPRYVTMTAIAKHNGPDAPHLVANEYVSMKLGLALELPVVMGAISKSEDEDQLVYLSFRVGAKSEAPPPVIPAHLVADFPDIAAGLVAFDIWIGNEDRHDRNLAYTRNHQPVAIFDHSHALFRLKQGGGREGLLKRAKLPMVAGRIVPELLSDRDLKEWARRIKSVRDETIRRICDSALHHDAFDSDERDALKSFLVYRRDRIDEFVSGAAALFKKMKKEEGELF